MAVPLHGMAMHSIEHVVHTLSEVCDSWKSERVVATHPSNPQYAVSLQLQRMVIDQTQYTAASTPRALA